MICISLLINIRYAQGEVVLDQDTYEKAAGSAVIGQEELIANMGTGYSPTPIGWRLVDRCIENVTVKPGSLDLEYHFEELSIEKFNKLKVSYKYSARAKYGWIRGKVSGSGEFSEDKFRNKTRLLVTVKTKKFNTTLENYQFIPEAKQLIEEGRIEDFFTACGLYYVAAYNRVSEYYALLSYDEFEVNRDGNMTSHITGEAGAGFFGAGMSMDLKAEWESRFKRSKMKIDIRALGIDASKLAGLFATDIPSFKKAVENAADALGNAEIGHVQSVVFQRWTENVKFRAMFDEVCKLPEVSNDTDAAERMCEKLSNSKQKLFEENSESLAKFRGYKHIVEEVSQRLDIFVSYLIASQESFAFWRQILGKEDEWMGLYVKKGNEEVELANLVLKPTPSNGGDETEEDDLDTIEEIKESEFTNLRVALNQTFKVRDTIRNWYATCSFNAGIGDNLYERPLEELDGCKKLGQTDATDFLSYYFIAQVYDSRLFYKIDNDEIPFEM